MAGWDASQLPVFRGVRDITERTQASGGTLQGSWPRTERGWFLPVGTSLVPSRRLNGSATEAERRRRGGAARLADMSSVRRSRPLARSAASAVNNAGSWPARRTTTRRLRCSSHQPLGHFVLTGLLLPALLRAGARESSRFSLATSAAVRTSSTPTRRHLSRVAGLRELEARQSPVRAGATAASAVLRVPLSSVAAHPDLVHRAVRRSEGVGANRIVRTLGPPLAKVFVQSPAAAARRSSTPRRCPARLLHRSAAPARDARPGRPGEGVASGADGALARRLWSVSEDSPASATLAGNP